MTYDDFITALCIWREARGESIQAKYGVLAVIRNRAADPRGRWPKTLAEVVLQPYQFSSFNHADPNSAKFPPPSGGPDWATWLASVSAVTVPLAADPTMGATFYCDSSIAAPYAQWLGPTATAADLDQHHTITIGRLAFYKI